MNTVKLLAKTNAQKIRFGQPWVYSDQIIMDRRTRAIPAGSIVKLEDKLGNFLGYGAWNAHSKICFRMLERDIDVSVDENWVKEKLALALAHRKRCYSDDFYRLVHAEGDGLPGVIIDRFGDTAVLQPNAAWADLHIEYFINGLTALGIKNIKKNASGRTRKLEQLDDISSDIAGKIPDLIEVPMNGALYYADIKSGQKTGLFYDQRDNQQFAAKLALDADVLDVFSHVGGFALAMLAGGAKTALSVDSSEAALKLAQNSAASMGRTDDFSILKSDAFDAMEALFDEGKQFDVVICDPPAFAPSKKDLARGLRAYERVARFGARLVKSGGYLCLCSCSHAAKEDAFLDTSLRGIGRANKSVQIIHKGKAGADHPIHPYLAENAYLKSVFFRVF